MISPELKLFGFMADVHHLNLFSPYILSEKFPIMPFSSLSAVVGLSRRPLPLDLDLQQHLRGQSPRWRKRLGADRRRWTGERGRNPFRDVNKIKEPDMIKHEVHHKGNVNLSPDPFIIKNSEPSLGGGGTPSEFMRPTSSI